LSSRGQYVSTGSPFEPKVGISRAVRAGKIIAVTGTAPLSPEGKTVAKGDAVGQAQRCLEIVQSAIEELGGKLSDVTRTRILLTRIEDWEQVATVHGEFFISIAPQTRSCRSCASSTQNGWSRSRLMRLWKASNRPLAGRDEKRELNVG